MKQTFFIFTLVMLFTLPNFAQKSVRIMSYNVENFFDTIDDPGINDSEFLPDSKRNWTNKRFKDKANKIARVITAAGEWNTPVLIGLVEIENTRTLDQLIKHTTLKKHQYNYRFTKGNDNRGINVALLFRKDFLKNVRHTTHRISFTTNPRTRTRDILHVTGTMPNSDLLDIFVCHFPSRSKGEKETEPNRIEATRKLKQLCNDILTQRPNANIIIMGDFNDTPQNKSILKELEALPYMEKTNLNIYKLYNLFNPPQGKGYKGTYCYRGRWEQLDQMIVSGKLLQEGNSIQYIHNSARNFHQSFMLTRDRRTKTLRPKRTYMGYRFEGGYSDHLPIIADFIIQ